MGQGPEEGNSADEGNGTSLTSRIHSLFHTRLGIVLLFLLLVVDVVIVVASGFLDTEYLLSQVDDCKVHFNACRPQRRLAELTPQHSDKAARLQTPLRLLAGTSDSGQITCDGEPVFGDHSLHDTEKILAYISMAILIIFLLEQLLRVVGLGLKYFTNPLCVLDLFVIVLSLALEILVTHFPMSGLLVLVRIWRFARTGYTAVEGLHDVHKVRPALGSLSQAATEAVWGKLPIKRWKALASDTEVRLEVDEVKLAVEVAKASPGFVLHALALENERLRDAGLSVKDLSGIGGAH